MAFYRHPQVIFTNKCKEKMTEHRLSEKELLQTLNYPDKTGWADFGKGNVHKNEKSFKGYNVAIVYRWSDADQVWLIITCWSTAKLKRHSIRWWWAHFLG